jgi:hypothetical protein
VLLFSQPPAEPDVTLWRHPALRYPFSADLGRLCLPPLSWTMFRIVSAVRISRTSRFVPSAYLSPCAMWVVFPPSDYYGNSVA